jgi:dUTP pyrophosphatase
VNLEIIDTVPEALMPTRATPFSAGIDLRCSHAIDIMPGRRATVGTGIALRIPAGHCGFICSRSGLASKNGIMVLNSPGTIDEDYRGEIRVVLFNSDPTVFKIKAGDRIAQLLIMPAAYPGIVYVSSLDATGRGSDGFGSSGVS